MANFTQNNGAATTNQFEQALGFLNLTLAGRKFGMIPLKASNANEKALFNDLNTAPAESLKDANGDVVQASEEDILQWIVNNLQVSFRANTSGVVAPLGYKKAA